MKFYSFLLITFLVLVFSSENFGQRISSSVEVEVEVGDVEIEVEVEFGRKKKGCTGIGVCSVSGDIGKKSFSTLSYSTTSRQLVLKVEMEGLKVNQGDKIQYFEGKSTFTVEEEWVLPENLRQQLKIDKKHVIKPGSYPFKKVGGYYLIGFKA